MKLTIKTYRSNCTIFGDEGSLDLYYDGDVLDNYLPHPTYAEPYESKADAIEACRDDYADEIRKKFPDAVNIDEILDSVMIYAGGIIGTYWDAAD